MKKILACYFILVLFLMSCRKDELVRTPEFSKGINFTAVIDPDNYGLNVTNLANAKIVINTKSESASEIEKVDLSTVLVRGGVSSSPRVVKSLTSADLNGTVTITAQEFAAAFGKTLNDLAGGDQFKVRYVATMKNGMVFSDANSSQGVLTSAGTTFSTSFSVLVFCPSTLAGTYDALTTGTSTDMINPPSPNPTVDFPSQVTITAVPKNNTAYRMTDSFGGLYLKWYNVYKVTKRIPATFDAICGTINVIKFTGPVKGSVTGTGTYNDDGTITINWKNNSGDAATTVYTKQ